MKIQFASDLHYEFLEKQFPGYRIIQPAEADVLVIAGDIHHGPMAIDTFADWPVPVVYVHGNHELYRHEYGAMLKALRARAQGSNVHFLERDEVVIQGVRFLGCCLWTDYCLPPYEMDSAMQAAEGTLPDHRLIRFGVDVFSARDAQHIHAQSRHWLENKLAESFAGPTVVVSHHGPHPESVHARFAGSIINAAFVSDLTPLLGRAQLWIHGHVHDSFDYEVAGTRVVTNPRGYATNRLAAASPEQLVWENPVFDSRRVVEVS
ncbi:Icc-related predicted phosphoesterase [Paucimonas lemoignei]|uniref:Icc-related predicted phosphoesterase n=1 Tax=Paucimonas lemoignei TaxID=29443 RepID=A0A4R3HRK5_PAULE|nr:metallophosphoesterase [Paucimonas lemoignei]TCS33751.1 Icc-related predicted phosphoesterase [Paucimonas lemoignei]